MQGRSQDLEKGGGVNNHDYITKIMLKALKWMNRFDAILQTLSSCDRIVNNSIYFSLKKIFFIYP